MANYVRAKGGHILRHPETGTPVVPDPTEPLPDTDPLVKAHPWAFASEEEIAEELQAARSVSSVEVEQATRRPGEKRSTKRS